MRDTDEELQEFSLEDIMREFGEGIAPAPSAAGELPAEEAPAEAVEEAPGEAPREPEAEPAGEAPEEGEAEPVTGDTIRLDDLGEVETEAGEDPEEDPEEEPEAEEPAPEQEAPAPYSQGWEPEYEQPMGEYIPPEPIQFRPRSRLRELKRKLVAGPEKRYYELSEAGGGRLHGAIFLNLLVALISAGTTVLYAMGQVEPDRLRLMVFGQFFAMLLSALLGSQLLVEGIADLFHKRFTLHSLLIFTFIACCADGVLGLRELRVPCCAAFSLETTMALFSANQRRMAEMGQMDALRKAVRLDSVTRQEDYWESRPGFRRGEGQVEDFMDHYQDTTKPEKIQNIYALSALLVSIGLGVTAGVLHNWSFAVQVLAVSLLAALPGSFFVSFSRPLAILVRRLHQYGTVICGWQGVKGLCGKAFFPLSHSDLFPVGSIRMNGVKFYSSRDTDQVVAYAAALIEAGGGGLAPLFTGLLESRNGRHYDLENFRSYPGGIGGEVNGEPVLMGVLEFMKDMGVEIPEGTMVNQAVYVSVDGELCGLFAFTYEKTRSAGLGLGTLCLSRGLSPVMTTGDFMLTDGFIKAKFGVNTRRIRFPGGEERQALESKVPAEDSPALALLTQDGLAPMAYAVTGARALRSAWITGLGVHLLAGIVGLAMMAVLAVLGEAALLTPANLFLYQLVWMIPGLLITELARSF